MKATMDIPDDLYRKVKAKSALQGLTIREVTTELYRGWLTQDPDAATKPSADEWLAEWVSLGQELLGGAISGPTATEIIAADRGRLEPNESC